MFFNFLSESTLLRELSFDEKKLRFEENVIFLTKFLGVLYGIALMSTLKVLLCEKMYSVADGGNSKPE